MFASSQITSYTEPVAKKSHFRAVFILMVAMRACLAAGLAGLLCKLHSKANLGLLAYSLGEVVKKERRGLSAWKVQRFFLIYHAQFAFSQERG